jgi:hypothetical protein
MSTDNDNAHNKLVYLHIAILWHHMRKTSDKQAIKLRVHDDAQGFFHFFFFLSVYLSL